MALSSISVNTEMDDSYVEGARARFRWPSCWSDWRSASRSSRPLLHQILWTVLAILIGRGIVVYGGGLGPLI
jgi:hypothetical protein